MATGLQETGRLLPILQIQIIHSSLCRCVGSVGCSPYLPIREISMRTLCRCLHTLHAYTCGSPPRGCCTSFARAASGTNPIPRYVVPWLPRFFSIPRSDNDLANALIDTGFSLLIAHHSSLVQLIPRGAVLGPGGAP